MRVFAFALGGAAILALSFAGVRAQTANTHTESAETWAWGKISADKIADFDSAERCGKKLNPYRRDGWDDPCRQISPQFLTRILTNEKWRGWLPRPRIRLRGAHIAGKIDLSDVVIEPEVWIDGSRIEGNLILADSHLGHLVSLEGSFVAGDLSGQRMRAANDVLLDDGSMFSGRVDLGRSKISGDLVLSGSYFLHGMNGDSLSVSGSLFIRKDALFLDKIILTDAKINNDIDVSGSVFNEEFDGNGLSVHGRLFMNGKGRFGGEVNFVGAKMGFLDMTGSSFDGPVTADSMSVEGNLFMRDGSKFKKPVRLVGAKIGGNLEAESSSFDGGLDVNYVRISGYLLMKKTTARTIELVEAEVLGSIHAEEAYLGEFSANYLNVGDGLFFDKAMISRDLHLISANVTQSLQMIQTIVSGKIFLNSANISGNIFMRNGEFANNIDLKTSKIGGNLETDNARFYGKIRAQRATIKGSMFAQNTQFWDDVELSGAKIGNFLKLDDASAARIDLSQGDAGQLLLFDVRWWCSGGKAATGVDGWSFAMEESHGVQWPLSNPPIAPRASCDDNRAPGLILSGFHVGDFEGDENAWPPAMKLEGFHYDQRGDGADDVLQHPQDKWKNWLGRDGSYSMQPYIELSSVLAAAGLRDMADAVNLAGHERERHRVCAERRWTDPLSGLHCVLLTSLFFGTGYGIGVYGFVVFAWVLGFTAFGAFVLWYSPNARKNGYFWRFGASLHWLLPIIELSKEFSKFFENPAPQFDEEANLSRMQVAYFAVHAIAGWVLGFFLLAAMGGLIQKG